MTLQEFEDIFEFKDPGHIAFGEHAKFDRVSPKRSGRRDLHAFLLLDELLPGKTCPILGSAQHDEVFLSIDCAQLAAVISPVQVVELVRCGIRYEQDSLAMFV